MRSVKFITVQCIDPSLQAEDGHHYTVRQSGEIIRLRNEDTNSAIGVAANCDCISLGFIGAAKEGRNKQNQTRKQEAALFNKIVELSERYQSAQIIGAHELSGEPKPPFDVKAWLANYTPELAGFIHH